MILTGALAQGEDPSAADAQDALRRLNRMVSAWRNLRLTCYVVEENVYPFVGSQQEYTIGPGGDFDQFRPQWLSYCDLILAGTSPAISIKLNIITVKDWSFQSVKAQTSTQPTQVYYYTQFPQTGADAGLGKLIFWPKPTNVNSVRLYCPRGIDAFDDFSTDYSFPPGYEDALEYGLAVRLIQAGFGLRSTLQDIKPMADETLGVIKRANIQPVVASIDPALRSAQPGWNWRIGAPNTGGR
jgi:hypothetical protein